jgi:UDP-N-acetyl-D-mannosaminuronic acid dehydrogenase
MKVCVVGLGYIGLPTASLLATKGYGVVGVDVKKEVVDTLNRGEIHIFEPSLDVLVRSAVGSGKLKASLTPEEADIFILAVPTPFKEGHKPDLGYVDEATQAIAPYVRPGNLVILESTSPVGTTERIEQLTYEVSPQLRPSAGKRKVHFAHCPERVLPGKILQELIENDRIVGGVDSDSTEAARRFYESFVSGKVIATDSRTAEMAKLTENAFRDVNIAFANELSMICEDLNIDVWELIGLANRHPRVNILSPGAGVGGHCIAVDPWFIVDAAPKKARLLKTAREVNDHKPHHVVERVLQAASELESPMIACLGLTYKADVDDTRESPSIEVASALHSRLEGRGQILVVDPMLKGLPDGLAGRGIQFVNLEEALERSNVIVSLTGHTPFKKISNETLKAKRVIDACGIWK